MVPIAEFAYNNSVHLATRLSPFYATYGYHPSLTITNPSTSLVPAAEDRIRYLHEIHEEIKAMIKIAGDQAKKRYDAGSHLYHTFQVGDKVLLRQYNITTIIPSRKLTSKFLGPFLITAKLSDVVYRLKLPKTLRIHNVFHISLLEKYQNDTIIGRKKKPPPPIITPDGDIEWEVNQVLDSRIFDRWKKLQYLVSWEGHSPEQNSWEPAEHFKNATDAVQDFHRRHPTPATLGAG